MMPKIDDYSINRGIVGVFDPVSELARGNLPRSTSVVPGDGKPVSAPYSRDIRAGMEDVLKDFVHPDIKNRELRAPQVMAAVLDRLMSKLETASGASAKQEALHRCLEEIQEDKKLYDMYRSLLVSG